MSVDRIRATSTSTGTGVLGLTAVTGYRTFSSEFTSGSTIDYVIEGRGSNGKFDGDWEIGIGTLDGSGNLVRSQVTYSSNANALMNFHSHELVVVAGITEAAIRRLMPSVPVQSVFSRTGTVTASTGDYSHLQLNDIGNNTHAQIDSAIALASTHFSTASAHGVATVAGLTEVQTFQNKTFVGTSNTSNAFVGYFTSSGGSLLFTVRNDGVLGIGNAPVANNRLVVYGIGANTSSYNALAVYTGGSVLALSVRDDQLVQAHKRIAINGVAAGTFAVSVLSAKGESATSANFGLTIQDSSNNNLFLVRNDGYISVTSRAYFSPYSTSFLLLGNGTTTGNTILTNNSGGTTTFRLLDNGQAVFGKSSSVGLLVDTTTPTFGWSDMLGYIIPKTTGAGAPTISTFRGGAVRQFSFAGGDNVDLAFHVPHDYALGTNVYLHTHWAHNGTAISGNLVLDYAFTYQKGHNQGIFASEKTSSATISTPDIATIPQYRHRVEEIQLSTSGGSTNMLDSSILEPDGVILLNAKTTTIPTITGGSPNAPFIFFIDIHYQSTGIQGTKAKVPDFYT